jgi:hypothetical protein
MILDGWEGDPRASQNPVKSNQHGTQTIASQPCQFTWYILKMILDGWEGDMNMNLISYTLLNY